MDGGAWWAAVHGVATSRTRLSDVTHFSLSCIGEGNDNPLQCSCLENPRDRGAWWAAVYGTAQSQTRLKWLSRSSSIHDHQRSTIHSEWGKSLNRIRFFDPLGIAHQAPLSVEFSRQEYWSELPFPSSGDLPDWEIEPRSPALRADSLLSEPPGMHKHWSCRNPENHT